LGRIDAISASTGKTLWSWETEASNYSSILSTSGGLLFNGGMDRYFRAFDQENGKVLWQTRLATSVAGTPVTFSVKGRQYVAIAAGSGHLSLLTRLFPKIDQPGAGNALYVFALPE
jgi:alcohol dehydrogenase (cytochrome c)